MSAVKIDYITCHNNVSLPGPGTSKRWYANGKIGSGTYTGQVAAIVRDDAGYWLQVSGGSNSGWYHVPFQNVEFAKGTPAHAYVVEPEAVEAVAAPVAQPKKAAKKT